MALQLGHRKSMDLDFAVFTERLPAKGISDWIGYLRAQGVTANNLADPQKASQFRINTGQSLDQFAQDYEIAGVKVTFFAHGGNRAQRHFYQNAERTRAGNRSFSILGIDGLKAAKTLVLADRARSRDLFDVMTLIERCNLTIDDMVGIIQSLGRNNDYEHYFSVMSGEIPLDDEDEGLQPIGVDADMAAVYQFLNNRIDEWQIRQTENTYRK